MVDLPEPMKPTRIIFFAGGQQFSEFSGMANSVASIDGRAQYSRIISRCEVNLSVIVSRGIVDRGESISSVRRQWR